jgi:hypothetical protein
MRASSNRATGNGRHGAVRDERDTSDRAGNASDGTNAVTRLPVTTTTPHADASSLTGGPLDLVLDAVRAQRPRLVVERLTVAAEV